MKNLGSVVARILGEYKCVYEYASVACYFRRLTVRTKNRS